ncbi:MAG: hypothetical protein ACYC7D_16060 [Nitrososphaerales archaeon]
MSLRLVNLNGQRVVLDDYERLFQWIASFPYFVAGRRYGWPGPGAGINISILTFAKNYGLKICIVGGHKFDRFYVCKLTPDELLNFSTDHRSIEQRGGIEVRIIPIGRDYCDTVIEPELVSKIVKLITDSKV